MEEMIDVLNENGIKTGEVITRSEIHKRGLWHKIVVIAIVDEQNQLLMQQRSFKKITGAGKWDVAAAGHVSSGQSSVEAAVREINEEVGIKISANDLKYITTYKKISEVRTDFIDKQIFDCYIVKIKEINMQDITLQESEVADAKLVTKEEFKYMLENENMVKRPVFYNELINYLFK